MAQKMFVRLTPEFSGGICTDTDPEHPFSADVVIVAGKGNSKELPVYQVSANPYIKNKVREGILEEVRDFDGTPRNDPEHPDHPDNPQNSPKSDKDTLAALSALAAPPAGHTDDEVQAIVSRALDAQSQKNTAEQQKAIEAAVAKAVAALKQASS